MTSPFTPVTATGTPLGAIHATGGPGGKVVVVVPEAVVGGLTVGTVVVVDGTTVLIGSTVTPAQPATKMSATRRPGTRFTRLNSGTACRLTGIESVVCLGH